jgi:ABC-type Mn2+/Zn2+ transport system permease subunit
MIQFLSYDFIQRALITGVLLAATCSVLAFFVVLRRMAFIGVGISHAALGGVAIGIVLGLPPVLTAGVFSVAVAWLIGWVSERGQVSEDTAIGVFFPTAMALGIALISFSPTYFQDVVGYLFGSILSVRWVDVWFLAGLTLASLGLLTFMFKELLFWGVDEEGARAAGLPTSLLRYLLLTVLAVTIVSAMKLVGTVLISAFLVIPAATGQAVAKNIKVMVTVAIASGIVSVVGGIWLAWAWDLPAAASIILFAALLFFAAFLGGGARRRSKRRRLARHRAAIEPENTDLSGVVGAPGGAPAEAVVEIPK